MWDAVCGCAAVCTFGFACGGEEGGGALCHWLYYGVCGGGGGAPSLLTLPPLLSPSCSPPLHTHTRTHTHTLAGIRMHASPPGILAVKCVPFLVPEPVSRYSLDTIPVSYVMKSPVVTLKGQMKVGG